MEVDGLSEAELYQCEFKQASDTSIRKAFDASFVKGSNGLMLDCGTIPAGFRVAGIAAAVEFGITIKGTTVAASYAGPVTGKSSLFVYRKIVSVERNATS